MKVPKACLPQTVNSGGHLRAIGMAMFVQRLEETRPQDPTTRYAGLDYGQGYACGSSRICSVLMA